MTQVIIFRNDSGGVAICVPTGDVSIESVMLNDIPPGTDAVVVDDSILPSQDNDFFNAWEISGSVVSVNLNKAKEITKRRLRAEREPLLAAQDVAYMKALEQGQDTYSIVAEKQRLRDITNLTDACATTSELRALSCK